MKHIASQRGQTLLELIIVFPVVIGFVLAAVVAADRIGFRLAVHWAARHAARAAAVHGDGEACTVAREAAVQSLAPWGVKGVEVECGVVQGGADYKSAVLKIRAAYKAADHGKSADLMKTVVYLKDGADYKSADQGAFPVMYAPR